MLGVKTGFTTHAGRTYVGMARRGDRTVLVTLMGIHEPSADAARKLLKIMPEVLRSGDGPGRGSRTRSSRSSRPTG